MSSGNRKEIGVRDKVYTDSKENAILYYHRECINAELQSPVYHCWIFWNALVGKNLGIVKLVVMMAVEAKKLFGLSTETKLKMYDDYYLTKEQVVAFLSKYWEVNPDEKDDFLDFETAKLIFDLYEDMNIPRPRYFELRFLNCYLRNAQIMSQNGEDMKYLLDRCKSSVLLSPRGGPVQYHSAGFIWNVFNNLMTSDSVSPKQKRKIFSGFYKVLQGMKFRQDFKVFPNMLDLFRKYESEINEHFQKIHTFIKNGSAIIGRYRLHRKKIIEFATFLTTKGGMIPRGKYKIALGQLKEYIRKNVTTMEEMRTHLHVKQYEIYGGKEESTLIKELHNSTFFGGLNELFPECVATEDQKIKLVFELKEKVRIVIGRHYGRYKRFCQELYTSRQKIEAQYGQDSDHLMKIIEALEKR